MAFMDEDREGLLEDFGVDVTVGADTIKGVPDQEEFVGTTPEGLGLAGTDEVVLVMTPPPASFVRDASIAIDGLGTKTIRKTAPLPPDGRFTAIVVA